MNYPSALRWLLLACASIVTALGASSGGTVHVKGYTRKDGTYVAPHVRSAPNSTSADNWSTKGNVNPYTGEPGTKNVTTDPHYQPSAITGQPAAQPQPTDTASAPILSPTKTSDGGPAANIGASPGAESPADLNAAIFAELQQLRAVVTALEARVKSLENQRMPNGPTPQPTIPAGLAAWRRLQKGMSKEEVRALLGEPKKATSDRWHYSAGYTPYVLFFQERVLSWSE